MPTPPYRPARVNISIPKTSYDGKYWGRYPQGDKPLGMSGTPSVSLTVAAGLVTGIKLAAAPALGMSAAAALTSGAGASNFVIYANGVANSLWNFNLSFGNQPTLTDTTHPQSPHTQDLKIPSGGAWQYGTTYFGGQGGFAVGPYGLDISAYTYVSVDLYTAFATDQFDMNWHYDGNVSAGGADVDTPTYIANLTEVVPALTANVWNKNLKIPLALCGNLGIVAAYKFFLRDNSNQDSFWDNIQLIPGVFSWIYSGGQARSWNGSAYTRDASAPLNGWSDASVNASIVYNQSPAALSVGAAPTGLANPGSSTASTDVAKVTINAAAGMWKATHAGFALAAYDHFTFGALPTNSGYAYTVQFYNTSGVAVGNAVDPSSYTNHDWGTGSSYWTMYAIPLSAFGTLPANVGGVSIKDNSGRSSNLFYLSGIGFYK